MPVLPHPDRLRAMMAQCKDRTGNIDAGCPCRFPSDCHIPSQENLDMLKAIREGSEYETWPPKGFGE